MAHKQALQNAFRTAEVAARLNCTGGFEAEKYIVGNESRSLRIPHKEVPPDTLKVRVDRTTAKRIELTERHIGGICLAEATLSTASY